MSDGAPAADPPARAARPRGWWRRRAVRAGALVLAALAVGVAWWRSPLSEATDPATALDWARALADRPMASVWMIVAYVLGGLVVFPVTVLTVITGILFGFVPGAAIAMAGVTASAVVLYAIGDWLGGPLLRLSGPRVRDLSLRLAGRGLLAVALMRQVPVAPFTLVSLAAGASHIRFRDYLIGTVLGMGPGVVLITLFGDAMERAVSSPGPTRIGLLFAAGSAVVLTGWGLHVLLVRLRRRRAARRP